MLDHSSSCHNYSWLPKGNYSWEGSHSSKNQPRTLRNFSSLERSLITGLPDPAEKAAVATAAAHSPGFTTVYISMEGYRKCQSLCVKHRVCHSLLTLPTTLIVQVPRQGGWGLFFWLLPDRKPLPMQLTITNTRTSLESLAEHPNTTAFCLTAPLRQPQNTPDIFKNPTRKKCNDQNTVFCLP